MCHYVGWELADHARRIRDLETDLAELVREAAPGLVTRAREVLAGDPGALRVLLMHLPPTAAEEAWARSVVDGAREGVAG